MNPFFLLLFMSFFTHAAELDGILCRMVDGGKEDLPITLIQFNMDVVRLRFVGAEPDRFFSRTGHENLNIKYTQFATKKNDVSPLVNDIVLKSTLLVEYSYGGIWFTWKNKKKMAKKYFCSTGDVKIKK